MNRNSERWYLHIYPTPIASDRIFLQGVSASSSSQPLLQSSPSLTFSTFPPPDNLQVFQTVCRTTNISSHHPILPLPEGLIALTALPCPHTWESSR